MRTLKYALLTSITLCMWQAAYCMEPIEVEVPNPRALQITIREMLNKNLPPRQAGEYYERLKDISSLIQVALRIGVHLGSRTTEIGGIIFRKNLGNDLYDIALKNNHRSTMIWLAEQGLVNFKMEVINESTFELEITSMGRFSPKKSDFINTFNLSFPMIFQGYGVGWGKFIQPLTLQSDDLMKQIVRLKTPTKNRVKITITLKGMRPPYAIKLSFMAEGGQRPKAPKVGLKIESEDPLDLFLLIKKYGLSASSNKGLIGSSLTTVNILNWPDANRKNDSTLNDIVITKLMAGRFSRKDIYRYILNLSKDYTSKDIQRSFDSLREDIRNAYFPDEMIYKHLQGSRDRIVPEGLKLLEKAYRNLMIDKGEPVK